MRALPWILFLVGNALLTTTHAQATPAYRLNDLAIAIADEPVTLRVDLARIALAELATIYDEEAERARRDVHRKSQKSGLMRWSRAVQDLALDYATLAESITLTTPVEVSIGPENSLYLAVGGRMVAVSSPRMNEQLEYEQRVIEQFCSLNRCEDLLNDPAILVETTTPQPAGMTRWTFSQRMGPVCETTDGLQFQFRNVENLGRKRDTCARVVDELSTLSTAIARHTAVGTRVDWNQLIIHPLADGNDQVTLNREGDFLRLSLPYLAEREQLLIIIRPWLAAKVQGTPYTLVVLHAGELLGPPGYPLE